MIGKRRLNQLRSLAATHPQYFGYQYFIFQERLNNGEEDHNYDGDTQDGINQNQEQDSDAPQERSKAKYRAKVVRLKGKEV